MKKLLSRPAEFFRGVWSELKKVTWPKRADVINHTIIVIVSSVIAVVVISVIDLGLSKAIEYYISLNK